MFDFIRSKIPLSSRTDKKILLEEIKSKFGYEMNNEQLTNYCHHRKIRLGLVRGKLKPGDELKHGGLWYVVMPDGTRKNKAVVIYEEAHGKIKENERVIFLDKNNCNFDLDNLFCITEKELGHLGRSQLLTEDREKTLLNILYYRTRTKLKEQAKELGLLNSRGLFKFEVQEWQSRYSKEKKRENSRNYLKRMRENDPEKYKAWIKKCNSYKKEKKV